MSRDKPFIDYYNILQVDPNCEPQILEAAYRYWAKLYHPDHTETADTVKFNNVVEAYSILRNPVQRANYNLSYHKNSNGEKSYPLIEKVETHDNSASRDADDHDIILKFLYKARREHAQNAGVAGFYIQEILNCSDEQFEFHTWYLKEKGLVAITEQGTLAITIKGVDHVISISRSTRAEKLLIAQPSDPQN
jgi:curved DNA-binding protein